MRRYMSVLGILVCIGALASMAQAATWPNEPHGSTVITENPFNPGYFPCNSCADSYGWKDVYGSGEILQDSTAPVSPPSVLSCSWSTEQSNSGCMTVGYEDWSKRTTDVYVGFWVKHSPEYDSWGGKLFMVSFPLVSPIIASDGSAYYLGTYMPNGSDVNNCHLPHMPEGCTAGSVNIWGGNTVPYTLGQWHRVEGRYKKSTTTTSKDGIVQAWLDGQLIMDYRNVNYADDEFRQWQVYPSVGNSATAGSRVWYDHVRVSKPPSTPVPDTTPPAPPTGLTAW